MCLLYTKLPAFTSKLRSIFFGEIFYISKLLIQKGREENMAFSFKNKKGVTYFLHSRSTKTKTGKTQTLYFFAKEKKAGVLEAVPAGYRVAETTTGLPILVNFRARLGGDSTTKPPPPKKKK